MYRKKIKISESILKQCSITCEPIASKQLHQFEYLGPEYMVLLHLFTKKRMSYQIKKSRLHL